MTIIGLLTRSSIGLCKLKYGQTNPTICFVLPGSRPADLDSGNSGLLKSVAVDRSHKRTPVSGDLEGQLCQEHAGD
jgi:hypothetical protein